MKRPGLQMLLLCGLWVVAQPTGHGTASAEILDKTVFTVSQVAPSPLIDGRLDDDAWRQVIPIENDFITYNPLYGELLPQKTTVWMAHDDKNLYFAFHCYDTEPDKIKTSITRRDNIFSDDWVVLFLDALGSKQSSYELFVNPNGIQGDIANSVSNGEDTAPDWVWQSAGRVTDDGYQVEIRLPLKSIQFKSGHEVKMGLIFARRISRLGMCGSWPELHPGETPFKASATAILHNIKGLGNVEVLPSITYSRSNDRLNPTAWSMADTRPEIGAGIKYNLTSTIAAEATVNPDFSQVESDAFQVEVNQRYPIFYSEKRPFFMEANSLFNLAGAGGHFSSMNTAVHTRRIANPAWGTRFTGTAGKTTFGVLAAGDDWLSTESESTQQKRSDYYAIARGKYVINDANYIGGLYTGYEHRGGYNRVAGVDGAFNFHTSHSLDFFFLQGLSGTKNNGRGNSGNATSLGYDYDSKRFIAITHFERYAPNFDMHTAFYQRTGLNKAGIMCGPSFYPGPGKVAWIKRIIPHIYSYYLHDLTTGMNDTAAYLNLLLYTTRQGNILLQRKFLTEAWAGEYFKQTGINLSANIQATNWLGLSGWLNRGDSIYYDETAPFLGYENSFGGSVTFQPGPNLYQSLRYNHTGFVRPSDHHTMYRIDIFNTTTTYQFNKYCFVRVILRYDSYRKSLLQDFLASLTVIPGTVMHVGYGGFSERNSWMDDHWENGSGRMYAMKRSFFFKASYLFRS